jgi:hypothetical protein
MKRFQIALALSCLASVEAWQSHYRAASPLQLQRSPLHSAQGPRSGVIVGSRARAGQKVSERSHVVLANAASADSCDPFNPEFCEPTLIPAETQPKFDMQRFVKLTTLFGLWYILNIAYNIGNKLVLNALPIPWTAATVELFFGFPLVAFLWGTGLRKIPKVSFGDIKKLSSQAFFLAATHVCGVISFGAGAISFTHILKATEPVWAALIGAVFFKEFLPLPVYLSLVPIMGGVALASVKELSFTWLSFYAGTLSAVTSAAKAILSKKNPRRQATGREPHALEHVRRAHHPWVSHDPTLIAHDRGAQSCPGCLVSGAGRGAHARAPVYAPQLLWRALLPLQRSRVSGSLRGRSRDSRRDEHGEESGHHPRVHPLLQDAHHFRGRPRFGNCHPGCHLLLVRQGEVQINPGL